MRLNIKKYLQKHTLKPNN